MLSKLGWRNAVVMQRLGRACVMQFACHRDGDVTSQSPQDNEHLFALLLRYGKAIETAGDCLIPGTRVAGKFELVLAF